MTRTPLLGDDQGVSEVLVGDGTPGNVDEFGGGVGVDALTMRCFR
jgi:hypothetical protein